MNKFFPLVKSAHGKWYFINDGNGQPISFDNYRQAWDIGKAKIVAPGEGNKVCELVECAVPKLLTEFVVRVNWKSPAGAEVQTIERRILPCEAENQHSLGFFRKMAPEFAEPGCNAVELLGTNVVGEWLP